MALQQTETEKKNKRIPAALQQIVMLGKDAFRAAARRIRRQDEAHIQKLLEPLTQRKRPARRPLRRPR